MKFPARKSLFPLFVLLLILIALITSPQPARAGTYDCSSQSEIPQAQCEALVSLYNSTDGDNSWTDTTGWLSGTAICDVWYGITCDAGNVTEVVLDGNGLTGPLPSDIGDLSYLINLDLGDNAISGNIPAGIYTLANLEDLDIAENSLTGTLSESIADLDNVDTLVLHHNQFSGSLPAGLGDMASIRYIYLSTNDFENSIPTALGNASEIRMLDLSFNSLTGSIPTELGSLTNMDYLYLHSNQLSGSIPSSLGNMTVARYIDLNNNDLTGSIPTSFSGLANLRGFNASGNELSGSIPGELGSLSLLYNLRLSSNNFTGSLPSEIGNLTNLQYLMVNNNQLTGTIPDTYENMTTLYWFDLHANSFSGALNYWLPGTNIEYLYYQETSLCTPVDTAFQNWLAGIGEYNDSGIDCPGTAVLQSPEGQTFETDPAFTWDEDSGAEEYRLYVTGPSGTVNNSWLIEGDVCSGGSCSYSLGGSLETGIHTWYIQTRSSITSGPWTDGMEFRVGDPIPIAPSGTISDVTPAYTWEEWTGADDYRLFVSHAAVGTVINEWYESSVCSSGTCTATSDVHLRTGNHAFTFQARNDSGTINEWSTYQGFKLFNSTTPDEAIVPVSPTGGASVNIDPTFVWNAVERASWYKIFIGSQITGKVYNAYHRAAEVCYGTSCEITPTEYVISGTPSSTLDYSTEHNWYVMPVNVAGNGSFSSAQNFVTKDAP